MSAQSPPTPWTVAHWAPLFMGLPWQEYWNGLPFPSPGDQASLVAQHCSVCLQCGRPGFDPWVRKIPWRRKWKPTPVFLPGESHGWRSLVGYSTQGCKESDTTERLHFTSFHFTSLHFTSLHFFSRGSPWQRAPTCISWISCIGRRILYQCLLATATVTPRKSWLTLTISSFFKDCEILSNANSLTLVSLTHLLWILRLLPLWFVLHCLYLVLEAMLQAKCVYVSLCYT